jgi:hypothetical protein
MQSFLCFLGVLLFFWFVVLTWADWPTHKPDEKQPAPQKR